ncbi:MAG TPA: hypothetical protein VLL27_01525 [Solirubrobacterales bacterium]|nr:hypothetical protein [Solirubrobacterales bacterium]
MAEWNERVGAESIEFFEKAISGHDKVRSLERIDDQNYELERFGKLASVRVWLCDVYRVSAADVAEIQAEDPEVNAIVTISNWNDVTVEGKEAGQERNVGVFTFKLLMGALNYDGERFLDYRPPERNRKVGTKGLGAH